MILQSYHHLIPIRSFYFFIRRPMMVIIDYPFDITLLSDMTTMCEYQKDKYFAHLKHQSEAHLSLFGNKRRSCGGYSIFIVQCLR